MTSGTKNREKRKSGSFVPHPDPAGRSQFDAAANWLVRALWSVPSDGGTKSRNWNDLFVFE